jgi:hypothetical protein
MPLEEVASFAIPPIEGGYLAMTFSKDGTRLLIGYNRIVGRSEVLGIRWVDLSSQSTDAQDLPFGGLVPDIDSSAVALDVDGDNALAIAATTSAYRPEHEQLWLLNRSGTVAPRLIHEGRVARFSLSSDASQVLVARPDDLELNTLSPLVPVRRLHTLARAIDAIALAADHQHVAIGGEGRVRLAQGAEELTSWQINERLRWLVFADRDLTLFGVSREGVTRFRWNEAPVTLRVPGARPCDIDSSRCVAVFAGQRLHEVDLLTGSAVALGEIALPVNNWAVDARSRRLAIRDYENDTTRLRIYQAAPEGA